jgi:hypothetical protein
MPSQRQNIGAKLKSLDACSSENAGAPSVITAGGALDNSKVTGQTIDRYQGGGLAQSAVITTQVLAALAAAETCKLAHEYQTSADGSSWDTAVVIEAATTYLTGPGGGGNKRGQAEFNLDLKGLKRYVRVNVTLDLSRANTDTASFATVVALGGFDVLPQ